MKNALARYYTILDKLKDLPLLIFRCILAYGFYGPAMFKLKHLSGTVVSFAKKGIPLPTFNAYLATFTEVLGVWLLILGLGTRFITPPLMVTMVVAILTTHLKSGFSAAHGGYQIPLYFFFMLFLLLVYGPGKISLDHLIKRRRGNR